MDIAKLTDALARGSERFQRGVIAVGELHRPHRMNPNRAHPLDGKCRECRSPWPCPTLNAMWSAMDREENGNEEAGSRDG
jgi:hypothetical protein